MHTQPINKAIESTPPPLETVVDSERLATFFVEVDGGEWSLTGEVEAMNELLEIGNSCGHPNTLKLGEHRVASHIEILVLNVYQEFNPI